MDTIIACVDSQTTIKGSRFLSFLIPFDGFEKTLAELRTTHLKATHCVYAYRTMVENQIIERFSDDGEPKGSSGIPILNVLRGREMINIAAIVVRYFGGTLLGVGGLVRAYTKSVLKSVEIAEKSGMLLKFEPLINSNLECDYSLIGRIEYLAKKLGVNLQKEAFLEKIVKIRISGSIMKVNLFLKEYEQDLKFRS
ncbi:IMPACT family protein [Helicobacter cappadocius]|uniref:YigZ family protein n=1 Tax=Helicobacter cappadocius TaxID=3063998 RepID=A0AA90Q220_9HELI|nr:MULTISPECIES: YigZ family protein [unclassified Helicobacter]MDO7253091.1 YigZ family protein [Helicobacter sp. faydin-H75]MDP2538783.1 YigZ family protein [Helicobacter sp. faydin-H76]